MRNTVFIGFSRREDSVLSGVICAATKSDVSHSFLVFWSDDFGGWVTLGSDVGGWRLLPLEKALTHGKVVVPNVYEVPGIDLAGALVKNRVNLGSKYGLWELFGMAWVIWNRRVLGRVVPNPVNYDDAWFCSEIVDQVLYDAGLDLGIGANTVDPGLLRTLLTTRVQVREVAVADLLTASDVVRAA